KPTRVMGGGTSVRGSARFAVLHRGGALAARAIGAAEHADGSFDAVSDDATAAVRTSWRHRLDRAFETVEHMGLGATDRPVVLVIVVAADFTDSHAFSSQPACIVPPMLALQRLLFLSEYAALSRRNKPDFPNNHECDPGELSPPGSCAIPALQRASTDSHWQ